MMLVKRKIDQVTSKQTSSIETFDGIAQIPETIIVSGLHERESGRGRRVEERSVLTLKFQELFPI